MSDIAEAARVAVILSDHASAETGKISALGVGWQVTGLQPNGLTPPQTLIVLIDLPQKFAGEQFPVSLALYDWAGSLVRVPTSPQATPPAAQVPGAPHLQPLRISQLVKASKPSVPIPGVALPSEVPCRVQVLLGLANGLPLKPGQTYRWRVEIDSNERPDWQATFHVVAPPPGPVVG